MTDLLQVGKHCCRLKRKKTNYRWYIIEDGILKGCKWQTKPPKNLQTWERKDNSGRKGL